MILDNNTQAFLALVRAGLWETDAQLSQYGCISFNEIYRLAEEQSVVGLVAAGLEHAVDIKIPKEYAIQFAGLTIQLENRNAKMNVFIASLFRKMRDKKIYVLLVKGQGVAQCYERPLWRSCGDIDLLLNGSDYYKSKDLLIPISTISEPESVTAKHLGFLVNNWTVELHGTLHSGLSKRIDDALDNIQREVFDNKKIRVWENNGDFVPLPGEDEDIVFVFTHILQHLYNGGIGLRQICDWCRLLWKYHNTIDPDLLLKRIQEMNLLTEWKTLAALSMNHLGMPENMIPLRDSDRIWSKKAVKLLSYIIKVGNFGTNRDLSYYKSKPFLVRKTISLSWRIIDYFHHFRLFPCNSLRFFPFMFFYGFRSTFKGI